MKAARKKEIMIFSLGDDDGDEEEIADGKYESHLALVSHFST